VTLQPRSLSLVVPVFNEEAALGPLVHRLRTLSDDLQSRFGLSIELIVVDDGSRDATNAVARRLIHRRDSGFPIRLVELSRNFGKEAALIAGLQAASGQAVIPIDADLQDPPEVVSELVHAWLEKAVDVVEAVRVDRRCDTFAKRTSAAAYYWLLRKIAQDVAPTANCGDFQLLSRRAVEAVLQYPERARLHKGLTALIGFRRATVYFARAPRSAGSSRFGAWRLLSLAWDGITSLSSWPLRVWTWIGTVVALCALVLALWTVVRTLVQGVAVPGYASLLVSVLGLGGVQLISLGVLGEYIARIGAEVRGRPLFHVAARLGFEASDVAHASSPSDSIALRHRPSSRIEEPPGGGADATPLGA
jgi:glycosyltransferase involved in cell wall biosynthesis